MKTYDSVVIGGGPAGVTAALYLLRSGAQIAWVEKMSPGGQLLMTETIDNYPGFPKGIEGWRLADEMAAHLEEFEYDKFMDEVLSMKFENNLHTLMVGDQEIVTRSVIVCSGAVFKELGVEREQEMTGRGVSYCALCDGNFFRGQDVAVVGGGNTALEESLYLSKLVNKVYLIHRRDEFRGSKCYQDKVCDLGNIQPVLKHEVASLIGENELSGVVVKNVETGYETTLDVTGLFIFIGYNPITQFLPDGAELDDYGFMVTDAEMRTNIPGLFAAGDVRSKLCRQVSTAVGDGATAANSAFLYLESHRL